MKVEIKANGKTIEAEISKEQAKELGLIAKKNTGYEQVEYRDEYYSVNVLGGVDDTCDVGLITDKAAYFDGNYYSDEKIAENNAKADRLLRKLRQWQALNDEPALQYAKDGMREKEKREMLEAFKGVDELKGINDMLPQLDYIIEHNKWLANDDIPMDEKYLTAYMIANGVNSANTPPPSDPTAEELMKYYDSNPEFQQMIEKKRLDDIKQSQQVPAMSASNGAVNAALTIKEKPTTWDDASKRTRNMFRER